MTHFVSPCAVLCLVAWLWRHRMGGEGRMFFLLGLVTASCRAMKSQRNLVDKHLWASHEEILFLLPSRKRQDSANVLYPLLLLNPCCPLPPISFCTVSPYLDQRRLRSFTGVSLWRGSQWALPSCNSAQPWPYFSSSQVKTFYSWVILSGKEKLKQKKQNKTEPKTKTKQKQSMHT